MSKCNCKYKVDMLTAFERGLSDKECGEHVWCEHEHWVQCSKCGVDEERLWK